MQVFKQDRRKFSAFLDKLKQSYELIAPVKKDLVRFEKINNIRDIYLQKNSYFPIKEYFFKNREILFNFNKTKLKVPKLNSPSRIFFGLRKCDLNAIKHQDTVFIEDSNDPYYKSARKNTYLLGYHCNTAPSQYCFCGSLNLSDFFDLMFYGKQEYFLVEVGSKKGEFLVKKFKSFFTKSDYTLTEQDKIIKNSDRLKKRDISTLYRNPDWIKAAELCLSCTACTALCPTCYCFKIYDELSSNDLKKGERIRKWSSCQLQEFTRVAGNHVFRMEREERFKHRIYHQLDYFKKKHNIHLCVGCARCIEGCPTRIDFVKLINEMKE